MRLQCKNGQWLPFGYRRHCFVACLLFSLDHPAKPWHISFQYGVIPLMLFKVFLCFNFLTTGFFSILQTRAERFVVFFRLDATTSGCHISAHMTLMRSHDCFTSDSWIIRKSSSSATYSPRVTRLNLSFLCWLIQWWYNSLSKFPVRKKILRQFLDHGSIEGSAP